MTVELQQLPITSPCPIELDRGGVAPEDRKLHCAHCSKDVHLLSQMTEVEARDLMIRRAGDDICVSYAVSKDGQIRFRPEPVLVPVPSLVRRASARRMSMAASIGAAVLLSACTPHTDPDPAELTGMIAIGPGEVEEPPTVEQPPVEYVVAGGITAEPLPPKQPDDPPCDPVDQLEGDIQVDGGLRAKPIDPPAEPPKNVDHQVQYRGGLQAMPIQPDPLEDR